MIYRHASPLIRTEPQAACLPEEEGEEIPTSQETTVREYSATDLVKQSGRQGGGQLECCRGGIQGKMVSCWKFGVSKMACQCSACLATNRCHSLGTESQALS